MAVLLPSISGGSVLPEYAATSISFNRSVQNIDGVMTPVFTAQISYSRIDYLVQSGKKVGVVTTQLGMADPVYQNANFGNIFINAEKLALLSSAPSDPEKSTFDALADMADALIREDLISRGIIAQ